MTACDATLEDGDGYVYNCQAHHRSAQGPRSMVRHRDGAWFTTSHGRVAVEIAWSDPLPTTTTDEMKSRFFVKEQDNG